MPPKTRFSQNDIIDAAFEVVRSQGMDALSARNIARQLNSSTQPIYSYLKSMKDLQEIITEKAFNLLISYETQKHTGHVGIDRSIGNVLFAKKEIRLWRFLHDTRNHSLVSPYFKKRFASIVGEIKSTGANLSHEDNEKFFYIVWFFLYGLCSMVNNACSEGAKETKPIFQDDESICKLVIEGIQSIWIGFKQTHEIKPPT
ncbi:MAG: TetR/AcrR family transcriptional regulator [Deltaproteobacteria bacterium]|nr:TetR/AcrR family transcriptional regulator [Deltaproteobacteria bacterium]